MQAVTRFTFTLLIALITCMGSFALIGCTDGGQQSQSAATEQSADSSAASDASGDEQDNCYGNDLPAVKK